MKKAIRPTSPAASPNSTSARAGSKCLGSDGRTGAISAIGAVSPPGGDISEPVSPGHAAHRKGVLGPERVAGVQAPLPGHRLAAELFAVRGQAGRAGSTTTLRPTGCSCVSRHMAMLQDEAELDEIVQLGRHGRAELEGQAQAGSRAHASARTTCIRTRSTRWIPIPRSKSSTVCFA